MYLTKFLNWIALKTSFSTRLYIGIVSLFILLLLALSFYSGEMVYQSLVKTREYELIALAKHLEQQLPAGYQDILAKKGKLNATKAEKIAALNEELQPIVNRFSKSHPDIGMGYFDLSLQNVVARGPVFSKDLLNHLPKNHPYLNYVKTNKTEVFKHPTSIGWNGKPILNVTYPIRKDGKIIGHSWANAKIEDILAAANKTRRQLLLVTLGVLVTGVAGAHYFTYHGKKNLRQFAEQIKQVESNDVIANHMFPELNPIIEDIVAARKESLQRAIQNERLSTIAQLAAGLAHDIRNPLTSIRGFLQLISTRAVDTDKEFIAISIEELDRINALIKDMLYLARPQESHFTQVNLDVLVKKVVEFLTPEARLKEITLKTEIPDNLPPISIDQEQIKQVLLNLLRNAFEAIDHRGEVQIIINREKKYTCIAVKDSGGGISIAEQERVFDPLYTSKNNGTGLGLPICRDIINRHNGSISLESEVGKGTTVKVFLPV